MIINVYRSSCQIVMKLESLLHIFEKYLNIKLHEISFSGSRVVSRGRTGGLTDRQTYITKLIVAFRKFENALKSKFEYFCVYVCDTKISEKIAGSICKGLLS